MRSCRHPALQKTAREAPREDMETALPLGTRRLSLGTTQGARSANFLAGPTLHLARLRKEHEWVQVRGFGGEADLFYSSVTVFIHHYSSVTVVFYTT